MLLSFRSEVSDRAHSDYICSLDLRAGKIIGQLCRCLNIPIRSCVDLLVSSNIQSFRFSRYLFPRFAGNRCGGDFNKRIESFVLAVASSPLFAILCLVIILTQIVYNKTLLNRTRTARSVIVFLDANFNKLWKILTFLDLL